MADLYTDYTAAVVEVGTLPGEVHYRRVDTGQVGHFDTARGKGLMTPSELHWVGDKMEG